MKERDGAVLRSVATVLVVLAMGLVGMITVSGTAHADTPAPPQAAPAPAAPVLSPGQRGPRVRILQARLRQRGWYQGKVTGRYNPKTVRSVRTFQKVAGLPRTGSVDAITLRRLERRTKAPTKDELANRSGSSAALDGRCRTGRVICIDKTSRSLKWVVDGQVKRSMDARFGASRTPTREGLFKINSKSRNHVSSLYGSAMPFAMFFSGGQAVHYSSDFAKYGYSKASHGCVNIRDYQGVRWVFDHANVGDKVVVYRS